MRKQGADKGRGKDVLVLTYWRYADALVQTYTLPYVRMIAERVGPGNRVHLVTLEHDEAAIRPEEPGPGIVHVPFHYRAFGVGAFIMVFRMLVRLLMLVQRRKVGTIHCWCTPAGAIGYVLSVLTRRALVIDSFEPHAEAMVENGTWRRGSLAFRLLFALERAQAHRACHLIAAASGMRDYAARKYGLVGKPMFVKPAGVDLGTFRMDEQERGERRARLGWQDKVVGVYAGKFGGIYLEQEVFDLFRAARDHWGHRFHVLLLTGQSPVDLAPLMARAGLDPGMFTVRSVPHGEVAGLMGLADLAITPVKPVPTKRYCTPIKDGEYWALGLPVIITRDISDDSDIVREQGIGVVLERLDREAYASAVSGIDELITTVPRPVLRARIRAVAERYRSFDQARAIYREIYG